MEENNQVLRARVEYNIDLKEEEAAFKLFQKKHVYKRNIIITIILSIVTLLNINAIIVDPKSYMSWALTGVCLATIYFTWHNQKVIRRNLMYALHELQDDKYIFEIYDECFSIKTILPVFTDEEKEAEIAAGVEIEEEMQEIPPKIVNFSEGQIEVMEVKNLFIIYLKKRTLYVLPKRCIEINDQQTISDIFKDKLGDDYTSV